MKKVLFLDDDEKRHKKFKQLSIGLYDVTYVWDYKEFVSAMENENFDELFLDHDLSITSVLCDPNADIGEKTGTDCAKWLAGNADRFNKLMRIIIHSFNPAGAENMRQILGTAGFRRVYKIPFYKLSTSP